MIKKKKLKGLEGRERSVFEREEGEGKRETERRGREDRKEEDGREGGKGREGRITIKIISRRAFPTSHFSEAVILSALLKNQISRGVSKSTCI